MVGKVHSSLLDLKMDDTTFILLQVKHIILGFTAIWGSLRTSGNHPVHLMDAMLTFSHWMLHVLAICTSLLLKITWLLTIAELIGGPLQWPFATNVCRAAHTGQLHRQLIHMRGTTVYALSTLLLLTKLPVAVAAAISSWLTADETLPFLVVLCQAAGLTSAH